MNALFSESNPNPFGPQGDAGSSGSGTDTAAPDRAVAADVFGYEDYRGYLRDRFTEMQAANPAFSQRGLARKAGIANPGFFNEVIKGRRRLSPAAALKMAHGLDMAPRETEYFSALVDYAETREPRAKLTAGKRMLALKNRHLYRSINDLPAPTDGLREIMRELDREWVLQAAGLDVPGNSEGGEPGAMAPMSETTLRGILDKLVVLREQADGAEHDPHVVQFNLQVAPRNPGKIEA